MSASSKIEDALQRVQSLGLRNRYVWFLWGLRGRKEIQAEVARLEELLAALDQIRKESLVLIQDASKKAGSAKESLVHEYGHNAGAATSGAQLCGDVQSILARVVNSLA
jgi:hypothetical protein